MYLLGLLTAIDAVMRVRPSQGSIAWAIGLFSFPYVSLPLHGVFDRNRFQGYVGARRADDQALSHVSEALRAQVPILRA